MSQKHREIVITGFGKFAGQEKANASMEAVHRLPGSLEVNSIHFAVKQFEIPVVYEEVDKVVPKIWKDNPVLVIHCGVHETTSKILLEKCSYSSGYCIEDNNDQCFEEDEICTKNNNCEKLETKLNVEKIVRELNVEYKPIFAESCDVGRFLCGYIYVKSLDHDLHRTLFLHVPQLDKMNAEECKNGILKIAEKCLKELFAAKKIN